MTRHISRVRRADRRMAGSLGSRENLCGGSLTDKDITVRDARRMSVIESEEWHVCEACIRVLQHEETLR